MIYFELNELNQENIYRKTLSMIEYLCDKYAFSDQRGIIEMANQSIIDHLLGQGRDFSLDVNAHVEGNILVFTYSSQEPLFHFVEEMDTEIKEDNIWGLLIDDLVLSADYQSLTINFYVKPHQSVNRLVQQTVLQSKESGL